MIGQNYTIPDRIFQEKGLFSGAMKSQVLNANNFYIRFLLHLYKINNAPQGRRQMIFVAACSQTDM